MSPQLNDLMSQVLQQATTKQLWPLCCNRKGLSDRSAA
jgi:hypothetical protein